METTIMTFRNLSAPFKQTVLVASVLLTLGVSPVTHAAKVAAYLPVSSINGNFTMLASNGSLVGGTNDVSFDWDGTVYNSSSDYTGPTGCNSLTGSCNASLSSPTEFFGYQWLVHDLQIFGPGSYTFDPSLGGGEPETGALTLTIGANQIGAHMLADWGAPSNTPCGLVNCNIDVAIAWNKNSVFTGQMDTITANSDNNSISTVWMLASADPDGNGVNGVPLPAGGSFVSFNVNFNLKGTLTAIEPAPVPLPAAVWLLGSGLLGLIGFGRRRKS